MELGVLESALVRWGILEYLHLSLAALVSFIVGRAWQAQGRQTCKFACLGLGMGLHPTMIETLEGKLPCSLSFDVPQVHSSSIVCNNDIITMKLNELYLTKKKVKSWKVQHLSKMIKRGRLRFDIKESCRAEQIGNRITFRYGDGTVANGGSFFDTVRIGDLEVEKQLLIQVDDMESVGRQVLLLYINIRTSICQSHL